MDLLKRTIIVALMPNLLVWGFWMNGIDNDRHFLWRGLIGPYWAAEKFIVGLGVLSGLFFVGWKVFPLIVEIAEAIASSYHEYRQNRLDRELERERLAEESRLKQLADEEKQRFLALPEAERNRILEEKRRREEEQLRAQREYYAEELRKQEAARRAEEEARAKEKARLDAIARSPEAKRKKALHDLIGGDL